MRFVSKPATGTGGELHSAVGIDDGQNFVLPPKTLLKVVEERRAGECEFDGTAALVDACKALFDGQAPTPTTVVGGGTTGSKCDVGSETLAAAAAATIRTEITGEALWDWLETTQYHHGNDEHYDWHDSWYQAWVDRTLLPTTAPSTIYPVGQPLVVVEVTFFLPLALTADPIDPSDSGGGGGGGFYGYSDACAKLCDSVWQLSYADRTAYIRGNDEIVVATPLAMEQEWARGARWTDWSGKKFEDEVEWAYVVDGAAEEEVTPVGDHERGHGRWVLGDFCDHINRVVGSCIRETRGTGGWAGGAVDKGRSQER